MIELMLFIGVFNTQVHKMFSSWTLHCTFHLIVDS